jgi:hypothetical protein
MRAAAALVGLMAADVASKEILTLSELNTAITEGTNKQVGFLSQGNYETVHDVLPASTVPVIATHSSELEDMVANGTVVAGLVSGVPDRTRFITFSSTLVSPRAMFVNASWEEHIDAAIVRVLQKGLPQQFAAAHPPFEMVTVFSCKGNPTNFPFPAGAVTTPLRIGALAPGGNQPDWGVDGNYTANPPTGYWPDYYRAIETEFQTQYGVGFQRVWLPSSAAVMSALENGTIDATEPYWTVDSFHNGRGRKHAFEMSCITMGYDSTFFTKRDPVLPTAAATKGDDGLDDWVLAIAIVLPILFAAAVAVTVWLIIKERSGNPVFQPLNKTDTETEMQGEQPGPAEQTPY